MLVYLDGYTNHKDSPNENFAREMLELYSIGKGPQLEEGNYTNYNEDDIKAATRVLTGWVLDEDFANIDADTGLPTGKFIENELGKILLTKNWTLMLFGIENFDAFKEIMGPIAINEVQIKCFWF